MLYFSRLVSHGQREECSATGIHDLSQAQVKDSCRAYISSYTPVPERGSFFSWTWILDLVSTCFLCFKDLCLLCSLQTLTGRAPVRGGRELSNCHYQPSPSQAINYYANSIYLSRDVPLLFRKKDIQKFKTIYQTYIILGIGKENIQSFTGSLSLGQVKHTEGHWSWRRSGSQLRPPSTWVFCSWLHSFGQ